MRKQVLAPPPQTPPHQKKKKKKRGESAQSKGGEKNTDNHINARKLKGIQIRGTTQAKKKIVGKREKRAFSDGRVRTKIYNGDPRKQMGAGGKNQGRGGLNCGC